MGNGHIIHKLPLLAAALALGTPSSVQAGPVFSFSDGTRAARVTFAQDDGTLSVTLENTSSSDVLSQSDVLTGIFFDLADVGDGTLIPTRALLGDGSSLWFPQKKHKDDDKDSERGIGGEYGFRDDLAGLLSDASMVISAADLGHLIGKRHLFPGENLSHSKSPAGVDYGLVSAFDDPLTGNNFVTGETPFVANSVVFELEGLPEDFVLDGNISGVQFNYGGDFNPVPEPSALVLMAFGAAAAFMKRRKATRPSRLP